MPKTKVARGRTIALVSLATFGIFHFEFFSGFRPGLDPASRNSGPPRPPEKIRLHDTDFSVSEIGKQTTSAREKSIHTLMIFLGGTTINSTTWDPPTFKSWILFYSSDWLSLFLPSPLTTALLDRGPKMVCPILQAPLALVL